jgi:hypothetical protein
MGAAGRATAVERYSVEANGPRMVTALRGALEHARSNGRLQRGPVAIEAVAQAVSRPGGLG